eukprot:5248343-Alexandrium_andersonii.AAC.1
MSASLVGSEMCIRDSACVSWLFQRPPGAPRRSQVFRSHGSGVSLRNDVGEAVRSPGAAHRCQRGATRRGTPRR